MLSEYSWYSDSEISLLLAEHVSDGPTAEQAQITLTLYSVEEEASHSDASGPMQKCLHVGLDELHAHTR